jgi:hypothetical protein
MSRGFSRSPAGLVLAATLLPLCSFAAPVRLQFAGCDSAVKGVPALSAKGCKASTTSALTKAVKLEKGKASLVRGATGDADVRVTGTVERGDSPKTFRVVYLLQTQQEPRLEKEVTYALTAPRFNAKTLTVTARELLTEAVKLEEARQAEASRPEPVAAAPEPAPVVAAPEPAPRPKPVVASAPAPVAEAPRQPLESSAPVAESFKARKQPLVVVHTGLAGLWGYGMETFGVGAVLEPKWNITDSIAAGLRLDGGVTFGGRIAPEGTSSFALGASAATLLKGEYLFFDSGVRPFVGLGAGMYILANQSVSAGNSGAGVAQSGGRFFGVAPQLGIDFGGVRLGATYNHILGGDIVIEQNVSVGGVQAERIQRNYLQLELSFRIAKFGGSERPAVSRGH